MQNYQLHLKGFVGGYDFDKNYVDYVLGKHQGKPVAVLIDSLGGSLATALSIASAFRNHGDVTVHFVGMNASAATIASLGAKHITMDASAMYLAHKCSTEFFQWAQLNADQLQSEIQHLEQMRTDLEKMDANVAQMYTAKCKSKKKTCAEVLDLMKVGGWLTAKEALDFGFVDELTSQTEDDAPVLTDAVASAMASVGMPIPNIPVREEQASQFSKFLNAIAGLFRPAFSQSQTQPLNQQNTSIMNKLFPLLAAVLSVESFALTDGACSLTEAQLEALEENLKTQADSQKAAIKEKEDALAALLSEKEVLLKEKADLDAKLNEQAELLAKQPGEHTSQVLSTGAPSEPLTEAEAFVEVYNRAREMYNEVP